MIFQLFSELITCSRHLTVKSSIVSVEEKSSTFTLIPHDHTEVNEEGQDVPCDEEHCEECRQKQNGALMDSLPPIVVEGMIRNWPYLG